MTTLLGPIGTSELGTLASCPRKFMYRYRDGLAPKSGNDAMYVGTLFHEAAARGYRGWRNKGHNSDWLADALAYLADGVFVDRDGLEIVLSDQDEWLLCISDMLDYYWQHTGQHDRFSEIITVDEEIYFESSGWSIRATMDLVVRNARGDLVIYDHKTSSDISGDQAHLPLDLQTHVYYLAAWRKWGRPVEFVHNFVRRFDTISDQMSGPPSYRRLDGTTPYALTKSGRKATRSDDPNDYVRRVHTPLSVSQLEAYERELSARLQTLRFHQLADVWPRHDQKLGFGCGSCAFYSICTTEQDGREVNPALFDLAFTRIKT